MSNYNQARLAVFAQILREQTSASSRSQQQRLATALTTLGNITTGVVHSIANYVLKSLPVRSAA